ncbi:MFS transporter [Rhizobium sp. Root1220]|uniref:MFS transporter n=1 Tax=Rhizobium sp. Root1220 TaxID=1736432 RepID=UPI0006FCE6E0|nr:MFS transporter [Rhizobium sp. Root1220]KQV70222.1 arabinose ABC transporter permease [Rhizobium sp. Root1220]
MSSVVATGSDAGHAAGHNRPLLVVAALMLSSFTVGFDTRVFSVGLTDLRGAFDLSVDQASWLATFAAAPQIFIAPAVAWLVTVFGVRRVMVGPCLVYAVISLIIPFMHGLGALIALHIVRALLLGVFIPATIMITLRNLDRRYWIIGLAIYSMRLPLSQNLGVFLVGLYTEHLGLEWLYWQDVFLTPLTALLIVLGATREPIDKAQLATADWGGMLLLGSSMTMIYVGLDQGLRLNWFQSGTVTVLLIAGGLLAIAFVINERIVRHPWAHTSVLASKNLVLGFAAIVLFIVAASPTFLLIPGYLETVVGLRPVQIGDLYIPAVIFPLFLSIALAAFVLHILDARWGLIIGFTCMGVGSLLATPLTGVWALQNFTVLVIIQIVGQGFTLLSAITYILSNADPKKSTANAAYVQVVRLGGAELSATLMATFVSKREQFHSNVLGTHVTEAAPATEKVLSTLRPIFQTISEAPSADALVTLSKQVSAQAYVLAYADGFLISFWAAIAGLVLASLMGQAPEGPLSPRR